MDDIHAPTVESGPTSNGPVANGDSHLSFAALVQKKDNLEAELSALGSVLDSHNVTMTTSLTTFDGYPRADIDVAQIRTTRARIIRLKNDHKEIMRRLETAVHERFAAGKSSEGADTSMEDASSGARAAAVAGDAQSLSSTPAAAAPATIEPPFAKVNTVAPNSPAAQAGLRPGDSVTRFGDATFSNHERLAKVSRVVAANENRSIVVHILRNGQTLRLQLTPRRDWGGRGLLGCHLLPLAG